MKIEKHNLSYKPFIPHSKIIRIRGIINTKTLIIIWFNLVFSMDLKYN